MSTLHKLTYKKNPSRYLWSNNIYRFRLSKSNAALYERLCKLYPHRSPQDIFNDLLSLAFAPCAQKAQVDLGLTSGLSGKEPQHVCMKYGPFAEFHGLVFKNHTAMDRRFLVDKSEAEAEAEAKMDVYALDERGL